MKVKAWPIIIERKNNLAIHENDGRKKKGESSGRRNEAKEMVNLKTNECMRGE